MPLNPFCYKMYGTAQRVIAHKAPSMQKILAQAWTQRTATKLSKRCSVCLPSLLT